MRTPSSLVATTLYGRRRMRLPWRLHLRAASSTAADRVPYWHAIPRWKDVCEQNFLQYRWQVLFPFPKESHDSVI